MSYNRSTQAPCSATCCVPADFNATAHAWLQDGTGLTYNTDARSGVYSNSLTLSADLNIVVPSGEGMSCNCDDGNGNELSSVSSSFSSQNASDISICQQPIFEPNCCHTSGDPYDCDITCSNSNPDCPSTDWNCVSGGQTGRAGVCISAGDISGYDDCFEDASGFDEPPCEGSDDCAIITFQGDCASLGSCISYYAVADTTWYASGLKIKGTPETFVGYPSSVDPCSTTRKGLRRIYALCAGGGIFIKWEIEKEWDGGTSNQVNVDSFGGGGNSTQGWEDAINLNVDVGIQGSGGGTKLMSGMRLGDGASWYDITNTEVEFYYQKTTGYGIKTEINLDYGCGHQDYCCEDNCTCNYTHWRFESSSLRRITSSTQVSDGSGNCIWDAHPSNWGSMDCVSVGGICKAESSTCAVS